MSNKKKTYPKVDGIKLDPYSIKKFNNIEEEVKMYLDMDNGKYGNDILAYNIAFLLLKI